MPLCRLLLAALLGLALCASPALATHAVEEPTSYEEEHDLPEEQEPEAPPPAEAEPPTVELPATIPVLPAPEVPNPLAPVAPVIELPTGRTVPGETALVRADGKAAVPRGAPLRIRNIIAAANRIIGKPYKWGGGHRRIDDRGYDCSGTVSYALIKSGLLSYPMVSGGFAKSYGAKGEGRWMTIYGNRGHVYMEVAGLRLDTSSVGDTRRRNGVRWRPVIGRRPGFKARHIDGL